VKIYLACLSIVISSVLRGASLSFAEEVIPITSLIADGKRYDGRDVVAAGEAVGDLMKRSGGYWINILASDGNAIGVFMTGEDQARKIGVTGDFMHRGDYLKVRGIMYRFAPRFGGETCIIAREIDMVHAGRRFARRFPENRIMWCAILTACSLSSFCALTLLSRKRAEASVTGTDDTL
jgi:hypothetical protein